MKKQRSLRGKIWQSSALAEDSAGGHVLNNDWQSAVEQQRQGRVESRVWRSPQLPDLADPLSLEGVATARDRILAAIKAGERIMVYGDFDCDGVTSTVALVHALKALGAQVSYRIPDREQDSHGLKKHLVDEIATTGAKLLVTVDCGVNDRAAVAHAVALGLDVIITDHHQVDEDRMVDQALAIINPNLPFNAPSHPGIKQQNMSRSRDEESSQDLGNLAGVGVVFKLLQALNTDAVPSGRQEAWLQPYLALAAIGTVADCVALTGESRMLVQLGLQALNKGEWPCVLSLLGGEEHITAETIGFRLAPCLNAASRLGEVRHAVQLFLNTDGKTPDRGAYLLQLNQLRKSLTAEFTDLASNQINTDLPCQILLLPECPVGILGLVASRICEQTGQATFCLNQRDDGELHASCRGPQGGDIAAALGSVSQYLNTFGGHAGAAGFRVNEENLSDLITGLHGYYQTHPAPAPTLEIAAPVDAPKLSFDLIKWQDSLVPFGIGNPQPVWQISSLELTQINVMGADENHARFAFVPQVRTSESPDLNRTKTYQAVAFNCVDLLNLMEEGQTYDLAITLNVNVWNGEEKLQWQVVDIRKN